MTDPTAEAPWCSISRYCPDCGTGPCRRIDASRAEQAGGNDPFNEWFIREFPEVERRHKDGDIAATGNKFSAREGWNAALQGQPEGEAVVWAIYAKSDEYPKPVRIPRYFGTIAEISKQVLADAAREGYSGTFGERMAELGWWMEPLFLGHRSRKLGVDVAKDGTETTAYGRVVDGRLFIDRIEQTPATQAPRARLDVVATSGCKASTEVQTPNEQLEIDRRELDKL